MTTEKRPRVEDRAEDAPIEDAIERAVCHSIVRGEEEARPGRETDAA